ncbi:hypothetical protein ElyMa_004838000 [Elysia marginata]|uniref:Uncharacterized protein n=1 Tax=Elysia marginata TaxID=1093978 RepID=A0AAV4IN67_9GAST|nr:hypothetical protein ElyMa_004838000 [Elysia marginata]
MINTSRISKIYYLLCCVVVPHRRRDASQRNGQQFTEQDKPTKQFHTNNKIANVNTLEMYTTEKVLGINTRRRSSHSGDHGYFKSDLLEKTNMYNALARN